VIDGVSYGLNTGMVGIGADNAKARIDNVAVQILPPTITLNTTDDFGDGVADRFTASNVGAWQIVAGRDVGTPVGIAGTPAVSTFDLKLQTASLLQVDTTLSTQSFGGLVFDYYAADNFKFAAIIAGQNQVVLGHYTKRGWTIDAAVTRTITAGVDYQLGISLKGTTASVSLNGQSAVGFVYNAAVVDGQAGFLSRDGSSSFDVVTIKTNDPAYTPTANRAPVAVSDSATTPRNTAVNIPVLANDTDADGNGLTVRTFTQPVSGTLVLNSNGTFTYTPTAGFSGTDTFTYKAFDGTDESNVATVTVRVNSAPVAVNDSASTTRDRAVVISPLANDTDADGNSLTVANLVQPANGSVVLNTNGTVTYTPRSGFTGTDTFTYQASDGFAVSNPATITVNVTAATPVTRTYSNTTALGLPDLATSRSTINITDVATIRDLNVQLNITHARDSDLQVTLIAPDGTRIALFSAVGGNGQNFVNTVLDDEATVAISAGTAPFTGSFRPATSLSLLDGKSLTGVWTLEIKDTVRRQTGTLNNWSLIIDQQP
jgi:subtilisin-like proprotein convertase family protein